MKKWWRTFPRSRCSISWKTTFPSLPETVKIEKVEKLITNLHDKTEYVIHKKNLKQALNRGLVFKKVELLIKFNQKSWLEPDIDNKYQAKKKSKKWLWERLFQTDE